MIEIIAGTNRPGSNALRIARIIEANYREAGAPASVLSLADIPADIFNPSSYAQKPASFAPFQSRILAARGLHLVVPEYNGSFPGVLKYFIDMLKFPESFDGKCIAFTGEAAGLWGAIRSVEQLVLIFTYRMGYLYPERVFIPGIGGKLDDNGQLTDPAIADRLKSQARGFAGFVAKVGG